MVHSKGTLVGNRDKQSEATLSMKAKGGSIVQGYMYHYKLRIDDDINQVSRCTFHNGGPSQP